MMPEGHRAGTDQAKQSLQPDQGALGRDVEKCIKCRGHNLQAPVFQGLPALCTFLDKGLAALVTTGTQIAD